jgi:hypothetical protein
MVKWKILAAQRKVKVHERIDFFAKVNLMQSRQDLTNKQIVASIVLALTLLGVIATAYMILPESYHFLIVLGIFCFGLCCELFGRRKRNNDP